MSGQPRARFLSLFVPRLAEARRFYESVFGIAPVETSPAVPEEHPFAKGRPVVFDLGGVALALYQCDGKVTHPGDVGIGVEVGSPEQVAGRVADAGGKVFFGPREIAGGAREMAVFVLPDRHFFEVVSAAEDR